MMNQLMTKPNLILLSLLPFILLYGQMENSDLNFNLNKILG